MYADPIPGKELFGREKELSLLEKRVGGIKEGYRQNIAILGPELVGKTSLILSLLERIKDDKILPLYLEIGSEPFHEFAQRFLGAIPYYFLRKKGVMDEDREALLEKAKGSIPKTVDSIKRIEKLIKRGRNDQVFSSLFNLLPLIHEETGQFCVVALDEFHRLGDFKLRNPFSIIGQKIMTQKEVMYIVSSSAINRGKMILEHDLSLLFGNFQIDYLLPFSSRESLNFLDLKLNPAKLSRIYKKFLIALTDGHPFYLDVIGSKIKELSVEGSLDRISQTRIVEAIVSELFSPRGTLYKYFENLIARLSNERSYSHYLAALFALADGNRRSSQVAKVIDGPTSQTTKRLERLVDIDLIVKRGKLFAFSDPMVKFWLRYVYRPRRSSFDPGMEMARKGLRSQLDELISSFKMEEERGHQTRIRALFSSFRNEVVVIGGRRARLPKFDWVEERAINGIRLPVVACSGKRYWVAEVSERSLTDMEARSLLDKLRGLEGKTVRKILICLAGADVDGKLLAQEGGIWIWSLEDLNDLLELYGKFRIVL